MNPLHVVVGVVADNNNYFLIAKRPTDKPLGNYWEFPGGKVETGETTFQALQREFKEEVNLIITEAMPWKKINYHYKAGTVLLDFWYINVYSGQAMAMEGQCIKWAHLSTLADYQFAPANESIIQALTVTQF